MGRIHTRLIKIAIFVPTIEDFFSPYVSFDIGKKAKRFVNEWNVNLVNDFGHGYHAICCCCLLWFSY
jgi:hypothetical protein